MPSTRIILGAMSGTSADGIDIAIVRIDGAPLDMSASLILHLPHPYSPQLRQRIFDIRGGRPVELAALAQLAHDIALAYAAAANAAIGQAGLAPRDITAIAAHGQTLFHRPPLTMQWLDPSLLANRTGCAVVSDFRRADCAAGGQGAPLVPLADYLLFRDAAHDRILLNLGGIANFTWLPAGGTTADLLAFDTGPGNCICDWLMRRFDPRGPGFDEGGRKALAGQADEPALKRILAGPYFQAAPPKSTDGPAMIELFREGFEGALGDHKLSDLLAAAAALCADAVADAVGRHLPRPPAQIIASGGGVENAAILARLRRRLPSAQVLRSDDVGVPSQAKEAVAFALLGAATLDGLPGNVPTATGAQRAVVLGSITPRP
jgi:anhydro-N-acetylmuramic acid kinase